MKNAPALRRMAGLVIAVALIGLTACDGPTVAGGVVTASGTGAHPAGVAVTAYSNTTETVAAEVLTDAGVGTMVTP